MVLGCHHMPRLLQCRDCGTVEILPDVLGDQVNASSHDPLLERLVNGHQGPLNDDQQVRRIKNGLGRSREIIPDEPHFGTLYTVPPDDWNCPGDPEKEQRVRNTILRKLWPEDKGFPPEFYATKDTFREDAGKCYERHGRPGSAKGPYACVGFQDNSKLLTDEGWMRRGRDSGQPNRQPIYLCTFCPYQSVVTTRIRMQRGDYSE